MTALDAAAEVLRRVGTPLHVNRITELVLESGSWTTTGKTPWATVNARIATDIRRSEERSRFRRVGPGVYELNVPVSAAPVRKPHEATTSAPKPKLTFADAAERVLRQNDGQQPLHYKEIARRIIALGLFEAKAADPANALNAVIGREIQRRQEANMPQRFVRQGRGLIGLAGTEPEVVRKLIEDKNQRVRNDLLGCLRSADPVEFEQLVVELFGAMGAERVEVTRRSVDGGVDVKVALLVGGAIPIKIAAQVKRSKDNVGSRIVKELRGGLQPDETGLIVTTSGFTPAATDAAQSPGLRVIKLMDGDALVDLMVEHEIWVNRQQHELLTLATPDSDRSEIDS